MIVKNILTGKYIIIKKNCSSKEYYENIILQQYNINVSIPSTNQVEKIKNLINHKYYKNIKN